MKTLSAFVIAFLTAAVLAAPEAEAKRFGGGMSLGKQYSAPRAAPQQRQVQQAAPARSAAAASGGSRWMGPLAGLAAGGLLAALFFGDAFEGVQILDLLLIAGLIFGGVMLFRAMRRGSTPAPAAAGAYGGGPSTAAPGRAGDFAMPPAAGGAAPADPAGEDEAPSWFDGPGFVEGAKTHFIRLQAAWDQADFRDISEYTTPQLFAELKRERERQEGEQQFTEVVTLDAELLGVRREDDVAVASVAFSGLIREEESGTASRFREIWHVQHPWGTREGDWLITGIQQAEDSQGNAD
jgi:predicted lipid-binding transport protein (Tim44 family)